MRPQRPGDSTSAPLAEPALHLGVDVERLLAAPEPALVVGDHQLPDLRPDPPGSAFESRRAVLAILAADLPGIDFGPRADSEHAVDLRLHVDVRFAAGTAAKRGRLDHLPDLGLLLGPGQLGVPQFRLAGLLPIDREGALAQLVESLAGPRKGEGGDRHDHREENEQYQG